MENAAFSCQQFDSSGQATVYQDLPQGTSDAATQEIIAPAFAGTPPQGDELHDTHVPMPRIAAMARHARGGGVRALRGQDLRQTRVLMQALCEMRVELSHADAGWPEATLGSRKTTTMALWRSRARALFTETAVEDGIEARLDTGFRLAQAGRAREAAGEFKRAYLLLCCVLSHARDMARRGEGPDRRDAPQPTHPPRPDAPLDRGA